MNSQAATQCALLCAVRAIVQACRMVWTPLTVYIADEAGLTLVEQAALLSGFPLGYMLTQVVGGVVSDRLGGKPAQSLTLAVFTGVMLSASFAPLRALYWLYLLAGVFAGPQQPAYSTMVAAWFAQSEVGRVSAIADMATVSGEFFACVGGPLLADAIGWRG
eukprot:945155-Prymnesium_polylepis.1